MKITWEEDACIRVQTDGKTAVLSANRAGLLSLAGIFTALADEPPGSHLHLDAWNALEDGSDELIIEKTEAAEGGV